MRIQCFRAVSVSIILVTSLAATIRPCRSATFTVSTYAEFAAALDTAHNNDADDIIYVEPGHYAVTDTLLYRATYNEGRKSLTISGIKGSTGFPRLDGLSACQIMDIDTYSSGNDYYIDVIIENLIFQNGRNANYGSGLHIRGYYASFQVERCAFYNNICNYEGGGLYFLSYTPVTVRNCLFSGNRAEGQGASSRGGGALIRLYSGIGWCVNNTFIDNTAEGYGDSVYFSLAGDSITNVYNNIFWGENSDVRGYLYESSSLNSFNNDYQICDFPGSGTFTSADCITADPMLDPFFVPETSAPVIDTGLSFHGMPTTDYYGNTRPNPATGDVDIGAVEYYGTFPTATPTGGPTPSIGVSIDMPSFVIPDDAFWVTGTLHNSGVALGGIHVFFILDIYGEFWFWPCWEHYSPSDGTGFCFDTRDIPTGHTPVAVLPSFIWPTTGTETHGLYFYGAMLTPDLSAIIGDMATREWGFGL